MCLPSHFIATAVSVQSSYRIIILFIESHCAQHTAGISKNVKF
jgi:hypothetical protein